MNKLEYNKEMNVVQYGDKLFTELNNLEQQILVHFIRNKVATKERLESLFPINHLKKENCNSVEVYVHRINKKLGPTINRKAIIKRPKINYYLTTD